MKRLFQTKYWKFARVLTLVLLALGVVNLLVTAHYSMGFYSQIAKEPFDSLSALITENYFMGVAALTLIFLIVVAATIDLLSFVLLTRRFQSITKVIQRFADGERELRVSVRSKDEIGRLGTAFNKMADTLTEREDALKATDRLRREFVANVAHDLGGPLTSIQGYLETILMKRGQLAEETQNEYLEIIHSNTRSLIKLVEELFELTKLDSKLNTPYMSHFSIVDLCEKLVNQHLAVSIDRQISLKLKYSGVIPEVFGDRVMISRALSNILENSLNFTPEGGEVELTLIAKLDLVTVCVADTGIGIPKEDLPFVFDRFYMADKGRSKTSSGTGLGLAIAKKILDAHKVEIVIESQTGHGTSLGFSLHTKEPITAAKQTASPVDPLIEAV